MTLSRILNWLFGNNKKYRTAANKTKPTSAKKRAKVATKTTAAARPEKKPSNKQSNAFAKKSKSFQKTYILLSHLHRKKLLKRVRLRAIENPELSAIIISRWLSKDKGRR